MPLYVIQVKCDLCSHEHSTGILLKLDDGPIAAQTIAAFCADEPVPKNLAVRGETFRCPTTGDEFSPDSYDKLLIVPAPYRV